MRGYIHRMVKTIPAVGSIVRPACSDITYRVVSSHEHGCSVEATVSEIVVCDGRAPRKLNYSEKRFTLAVCRNTGTLFDDRWRAWTVA